MKPADVYCMECRNNYCRGCSNIRHGHKSRAYHSVRRLEDFDTEDEEEITSSQTGKSVHYLVHAMENGRNTFDVYLKPVNK